jgi:hypothetical protein
MTSPNRYYAESAAYFQALQDAESQSGAAVEVSAAAAFKS